ncbi:MAG: alpha/beta hydrolase [Bacteroidia bacterium]|nr:alpha/beta hydrolase [Bacteroidia bacterium]
MKKLSLIAMALTLTAMAHAQEYTPVSDEKIDPSQVWRDVDYVGDGLEGHKMDIYLPKGEQESYKVIVAIYGSAWFANNAKITPMTSFAAPMLDAGYAVVSINHRGSPEAKWPAQINDVKAAIRFVRAHAKEYKFDTSFVGITGFSSGGHLAAYCGVTNGQRLVKSGDVEIDIEGNLGNCLAESSSVDAVVDWSGPVDMLHMDECVRPKDEKSPEAVILGGRDPRVETDWVKVLSPVTLVDKDDAPILIIHGDADPIVPQCLAIHLKTEYDYAGAKAQFISVPGGGHGHPVCFSQPYYQKMVDFFNAQSKR